MGDSWKFTQRGAINIVAMNGETNDLGDITIDEDGTVRIGPRKRDQDDKDQD